MTDSNRHGDLPTRRSTFILGAATLAGTVASSGPDAFALARPVAAPSPVGDGQVPFHGVHQAGILTPQQRFGGFAAFDVTCGDVAELRALFRKLTERARILTAGLKEGAEWPQDRLTITLGVGASLFDGRFGLASARPRGLAVMPSFRGDRLEERTCHGDLSVQVCAEHPDAVLHVIRDLARETAGSMRARWRVDGFVNPPRPAGAPRTFLGFKDGTAHPDTGSAREMDRLVWLGARAAGPAWARGGTYQVIRSIRLRAEAWDRVPTGQQEKMFGRQKSSGAPLDGKKETDVPDYAKDPKGLVTPLDSHIRRANPRTPQSADSVLLRRSYNVDRGLTPDGTLDLGLAFCCYQQDLARQFETVQKRLEGERLADFTTTTGGGYFLVLPGVKDKKDWYGSSLLGS
ncbi:MULTISPECIES: Dyp-type peroxidase [unclassified Streptomyces]|uniref:Dyp-type peroxidase n=1 Tax=unclassified Streptomyces TaxID=2593676 RepID=UPI00344BA68D